VHKTFSLSERRACRAIDQPRSTQRYAEQRAGVDRALFSRVSELSRRNPRYGYRRVWALLRRESWEVNKKRVLRLWREAGLKVPQRQHKSRRLLGSSERTASAGERPSISLTFGATTSLWTALRMAAE
jgi:putative transposase